MFLLRAFVALFFAGAVSANSLNCDHLCGEPYCGFLTLERGGGPNKYSHSSPVPHGLWPQVSPYGDSLCLNANKNAQISNSDLSCYTDYGFASHEWTSHGYCAAQSPRAYFAMVCNLSNQPLQVISNSLANGDSLSETCNTALANAGYHCMSTNQGTDEVHLLTCSPDGINWNLVTSSPDPMGSARRRFHMK